MTAVKIHPATQGDLTGVEHWLKNEYDQVATGHGFWNNIDIIREAAVDGRLYVAYIDEEDFPVAFSVCGRQHISIDILEVHPAYRRRGIGKELAHHCINQARQAGVEEITGLCEPKTSVPFWRAMGFVEMTECLGNSSDCIQMRMVLA